MMREENQYPELAQCGVVGDLHTAALIDRNGAVRWCCAPYFDSPSVFASLLDAERGGHFTVGPRRYRESENSYVAHTNILETRFRSADAELVLTDFMPIHSPDGSKPNPDLVLLGRQIECRQGTDVDVEVEFDPRPDYARQIPRLTFNEYGVFCGQAGMWLRTDRPILWDIAARRGRMRLASGDVAHFVFAWGGRPPIDRLDNWFREQLVRTREFWENWISQMHYRGRWRTLVERSALALKLLSFKPSGAIVAAPTTSLPEEIGGERNWDYRFSWPRDSAMTLNALFQLGFRGEAEAYMGWLAGKCLATQSPVRVLYPIGRDDTTAERVLEHLDGYRNSRPVRIGNAAARQHQLDVYGEVLETVYLYAVHGGDIDEALWQSVVRLAEAISARWALPDEGIWELRSARLHFTHSKLMCWTGLDRAVRLATERGENDRTERWGAVRDQVRDFVLTRCVHPTGGYLARSAGSSAVDASALVAGSVGFLAEDHPIVRRTLEAVRDQLTENGLVYRYRHADGLDGHEGSFNLCTFWLVEALAACGEERSAIEHFHQLLRAGTPLGLFAEQTDVDTLAPLGNFPQALTHVGLIHAAVTLNSLEQQRLAAHRSAGAGRSPAEGPAVPDAAPSQPTDGRAEATHALP